jgi:alpha-beta hydrolase superfamily lysophospholipase
VTETLILDDRSLAIERRAGRTPGLFWLGGYRSDMQGAKALAVDSFGAAHGLAVTRFDYSGHGESGGDFEAGTISRWLAEARAVFETTSGPQILVGSSMGGWLSLLLNRALRSEGASRVAALLLIAPATDMTHLMLEAMNAAQRRQLNEAGYAEKPTPYDTRPYRIARALIEDGERHLMFGRAIETGCPVAILQGARDTDVPQAHTAKLVQHLVSDPVSLTLVPDGDHRLSRPEDLELLQRTLRQLISEA